MAASKAGIGWAVGIGAVLVIGAGIAYVESRPKAPRIQAVICPGALNQNLDFSDLKQNHLVVQLRENCFGGLVILPKAWSYWYADAAGEQKGQWHAWWFENDSAPLGPFFQGRKDILGKPAHAAFRMEGRGSVFFYNEQREPSQATREQPRLQQTATAGSQASTPESKGVPGNGAAIYAAFCAECHGKDGNPPGPAALSRNLNVTDLRSLAQRNQGVFPLAQVEGLLSGTTRSPVVHGGIDMPVWGPVLSQRAGDRNMTTAEAAHALARYLESLQR
ncbi:MAG TPA: c-type cytochrome [Bryobacteraceae bacterium]|nr:c-type cytochrome [Bryobacteraceae bacterium]